MTKAPTRGEKKRRGRKRNGDVEREPSGKVSRNPNATAERRDAIMRPAIEARARQAGIELRSVARHFGAPVALAIIKEAAAALRQPWIGDNAGRRCAAEEDVVELWDTIKTIRSARLAYLFAKNLPVGQARGISLEARTEDRTDIDHRTADIRTDEERAEAATRRWHAMLACMRQTGTASIIIAVVVNETDTPGNLPSALRKLRKALA